jgi:hypothetical protein
MANIEYQQNGPTDAKVTIDGHTITNLQAITIRHKAGDLPQVILDFVNVPREDKEFHAVFNGAEMSCGGDWRLCVLHGGPLNNTVRAVKFDDHACTPRLRFDIGAALDPDVLTVMECEYEIDLDAEAGQDCAHYNYVQDPPPRQEGPPSPHAFPPDDGEGPE